MSRLRRVLALVSVQRWQCAKCGQWTERPLAPGETCC
jgi:hypothetical protein